MDFPFTDDRRARRPQKGAGADRGRGGVERTAAPNGSTPARRHF